MVKTAIQLNDYQQLMRRLAVYTPYNAVHTVLIDKPIPEKILQLAILEVMNQLGIGIPYWDCLDQVRFLPLVTSQLLLSQSIPLVQHLNEEMNRHFEEQDCPLRFFIIHNEQGFFFSITYNHWLADAYSVSRIMEMILLKAHHQTSASLTLEAPPLEACFKHIYRYKTAFYRFRAVGQTVIRFSSAFRTDMQDKTCTESGCLTHFFRPEVLTKLLQYCKTEQVTVNDLMIAILAKLFGEITQHRRYAIKGKRFKPKRNRIIIGVISNLRNRSQFSLDQVIGVFLGFFYLSFKSPEHDSLTELSQRVRKRTKRLKLSHADVKQFLLFKIQKFLWDKTAKKESKYRLFHKNSPITVGISNMVLTKREDLLSNYVNQYIRCSPTAMVCPIVFNLTTLAGHLSLGLNYRKTCYRDDEALEIIGRFIAAIDKLIT